MDLPPTAWTCEDCGETCAYEILAGSMWQRPNCKCERELSAEKMERERVETMAREDSARRLRIDRNRELSGFYGGLLVRTFDNFDPSRDPKGIQANAYRRMLEWSESFSKDTKRGFVIRSPKFGCGKTHLAAACGNALLSRGFSVRYVSIATWLAEQYREFDSKGATVGMAMKSAVDADLLIIDDFGVERIAEGERGDWTRQQLYQLIDQRCNWERPVIVTTNLETKAICERIGAETGGRIISRLTQIAELLPMDGPDGRPLAA
jgi:DNA replication protein DnaC